MSYLKRIYLIAVLLIILSVWFYWPKAETELPTNDPPKQNVFPVIEDREPVNVTEQPSVTTSVPQGYRQVRTADGGTLLVRDITTDPLDVYNDEVYYFADTEYYSIVYFKENDLFSIVLEHEEDFNLARLVAEEELLYMLEINKEEACKLSLDVTIPSYINFQWAGSYGLSFCPGSVNLPRAGEVG